MKLPTVLAVLVTSWGITLGSPLLEDDDVQKRDTTPGFATGEPIGNGKGAVILGRHSPSFSYLKAKMTD